MTASTRRCPRRLLRPMFVYRHRQVADDLAAHRRAADAGTGPLVVAVTGASGLVGSALCAFLTTGGHRVIRLVRRPARHEDERRWEPEAPGADLLDGVDAVVHLAGESIAGRFTEEHRGPSATAASNRPGCRRRRGGHRERTEDLRQRVGRRHTTDSTAAT